MLSKLSVKFNMLKMFSDSLKITVEDLLFIVGPNIAHISQESDFDTNVNAYDENNLLANLLKMHQKVDTQRQKERELQKEQQKEYREKRFTKLKKRVAEDIKSKKAGEFKEPPMNIIINLLGGFKLEVKRIHFRYEDDYFQHHSPFSFGLMIDSITMDNSETDWTFDTPTSMGFVRNPPINPKTVNKELNVKNIKIYWNSMSEMFVPTSLWEQTRHLKFQIFEAMDASFLKEIMIDSFNDTVKFKNNYLIAPFTVYTSINLNKAFRPNEDPYKYQINTLVSQVTLNMSPDLIRDVLKFQTFLEMFTYSKDLKRFRPPIRVQAFIDNPAFTPQHKKKKAQLIRDWFKMILWYVRLRKVGKGQTPFSLLEVQEAMTKESYQNALVKAKKANLHLYQPYYGSDEEDQPDKSQRPMNTEMEIDAMEQYEKEQKKQRTNQVLKDMLGGFKFCLKVEGVKAKIFVAKKIKRQHQELPSLEYDMGILTVLMGIQNSNIVAKILLKEIKLLDYYKREQLRSYSRQVNNQSAYGGQRGNSQFEADQRGRVSSQSQTRGSQQVTKGTFSGMQDVISKMFAGPDKSQYNTPAKNRLADIIYGSNDRSANQSRALNSQDLFSLDIPDPTAAQSKTRETLTINDILSGGSTRPSTSNFQPPNRYTQNENIYSDKTPPRPSKVVKAQKFQGSPTKVITNEVSNQAMNHGFLNARSDIFVDDQLDSVEKRCFFLMCGKQSQDSAISIDIVINAFDEASVAKKVTLALSLDHIIIEYCNEILKSLTNLGLQYKVAFNYADLKPAPRANKVNKRRCIQRMVEMQTPLYVLRKHLLKKSLQTPVEHVLTWQKKFYAEKVKQMTPAQVQKEIKDKQFKMIKIIQSVDKVLNNINFDVGVALKTVYLGLTGDKEDHFTSNQTLLEFGIDNQSINLHKEDFHCKVSIFGVSFTTLNTFEMLFMFANKLIKVTSMYKDNIAVQTSIKNYKDFIKNINKHLEKERNLKKQEEEKENQKKSVQPKIVILGETSSQNQPSIKFNNNIKINQEFAQPKQQLQIGGVQKMGAQGMMGGMGSGPKLGNNMNNNAIQLGHQQTMPLDNNVKKTPQFLESVDVGGKVTVNPDGNFSNNYFNNNANFKNMNNPGTKGGLSSLNSNQNLTGNGSNKNLNNLNIGPLNNANGNKVTPGGFGGSSNINGSNQQQQKNPFDRDPNQQTRGGRQFNDNVQILEEEFKTEENEEDGDNNSSQQDSFRGGNGNEMRQKNNNVVNGNKNDDLAFLAMQRSQRRR